MGRGKGEDGVIKMINVTEGKKREKTEHLGITTTKHIRS